MNSNDLPVFYCHHCKSKTIDPQFAADEKEAGYICKDCGSWEHLELDGFIPSSQPTKRRKD